MIVCVYGEVKNSVVLVNLIGVVMLCSGVLVVM